MLRIRDVYPWSRVLSNPDPGYWISDSGCKTSKKGGEISCLTTLLFSRLSQNWNFFYSWANWQRIIGRFTLKIVSFSFQKYGLAIQDPGSKIRVSEKVHPTSSVGANLKTPMKTQLPTFKIKKGFPFLRCIVTLKDHLMYKKASDFC